jgi:hypothetical protein
LPGDIADGEKLEHGMFERVKEVYGNFDTSVHCRDYADVSFKDRPKKKLLILRSRSMRRAIQIRSIKFAGSDPTRPPKCCVEN